MSKLTFESVLKDDFKLVHEIPKNVGENYERLTSFRRGRDFNAEVKSYMKSFVADFSEFLTEDNEAAMNERLLKYNQLVAGLKTAILSATKTPSVMISGGSNYPVHKKRKEEERIHSLESELYSNSGKHARFLENTRKMFDPVLKDQALKIEEMRQKRAVDNDWKDFFRELDHDELSGFGIDLDASRVYVTTNGKPSDDVRTLLKSSALKWSPKNQRWQRVLTLNAINALISRLFNELELDITVEDFQEG